LSVTVVAIALAVVDRVAYVFGEEVILVSVELYCPSVPDVLNPYSLLPALTVPSLTSPIVPPVPLVMFAFSIIVDVYPLSAFVVTVAVIAAVVTALVVNVPRLNDVVESVTDIKGISFNT